MTGQVCVFILPDFIVVSVHLEKKSNYSTPYMLLLTIVILLDTVLKPIHM